MMDRSSVVEQDAVNVLVAGSSPAGPAMPALPEAGPDSPQVSADLCCEQALNALDELASLALQEDTAHLVMANRIFVAQILTRAQLVMSFLIAKHPALRVVGNAAQRSPR